MTLPPVTTARTAAFLPDVINMSGVLGNTSAVSTVILSTTCPNESSRSRHLETTMVSENVLLIKP